MIKPLGIFRFQGVLSAYYTIPKINRELQLDTVKDFVRIHYTIPKINRELQLFRSSALFDFNYTIPKINRELQLFIRCQAVRKD